MGWSIGWDAEHRRDIGYGVPAYCDHPKCDKEIDRGHGYKCGAGWLDGCGLFFCDAHGGGYERGCARCRNYKAPYEPKADHPRWMRWKLTDASWAEWRAENPEEVESMKRAIEACDV